MAEGTTLAQAYVQIIPSAKGIKGMLGTELGGESASAGVSAGKSLTSGIKKAIIAGGIGVALKSAISQGSKLQQSEGGIDTLFKGSAAKVKANAQAAYKELQISANTYMEQATSFSAALLQSLNGDTSKAATAADTAIRDMSDNANKMGTDITSIQNAYQGFAKQNYTMLDNLKLGYGGTKTEMERLLADASKLTGQDYNISNLSDVYSAIHVIQQEMDITGTSAKEAETTLSGSFNAMKAAAQNFLGNIALGQNVTASMQGLVITTSTYLFKNLLPAIGNVFQALPAAMGTFISQGVPEFLKQIQNAMKSLGTSMKGSGDVIKNAFKGALNLSEMISANAGDILNAGATVLQNLANGIARAMPTIIETVPKIINNFANVINNAAPKLIVTAGKIITTLAAGIIKSIPTLIKNLPQIFVAVWNVFTAFNWASMGKTIVTKIGSGVKNLVTQLPNYAKSAVEAMGSTVKSRASAMVAPVKTAFNAVKNAITSPITNAKSALTGIITKIKNLFPLKLGKIISLKIPKISVSGGKKPWGIGGKGKAPSFDVTWAAKGGIVDGATLIGAGEAGAEGIVPLTPFWNRLDSTLAAMSQAKGTNGGNVALIINLDGKTIAQTTIDYVNNQTITLGTSPIMA